MSFEDHLSAAMRRSVDTLVPPVTGLAGEGLRRGRGLRRRRLVTAGTAAGVATLAVAAGVTAAVTGGGTDDTSRTIPAGRTACDTALSNGVLPEWARDGFSEPEPRIAHATSEDGRMVAILFGPLTSPSAPGRNNKILWVERPDSAGTPLHIDAVLPGTATQVTRDLAGPGPSTVDLPAPGCWTFALSFGGHRDVIHLVYGRP
ncbi:MAG: hypothetical protein ABI807_14510 [Sporichthyaceae bacterium]